ncbi:hypothetical protein MRB53_005114 [Persea americana]|uniref:Uncharacterized protein n=1 Tax=Persea americana TaxID=3435 RepID=A0ACC2MCJ6_PERAE|nr:hypothetical protein MRB53_005114 [Persea americana]
MGISFTASGLKGESIFLSRCFVEWPSYTVHLIMQLFPFRGSHITAVELDDDGEGDTAGPSGVGPSGVGPSVVADSDEGNSRDDQIGEVAINALNDRIGRLEVRVKEGFAEMRQGFVEMLDRLCRD